MEKVHPFEKAGLGQAPFRCIGLWSMPSKSVLEQNPEAYNMAMASGPKGLAKGCCDYCGTGILHHYIIQDKTGHKFVVGSECVFKTADSGLIYEIKIIEKQARQAKNAEKRAAEAETRRVAREEKVNATKAEWIAATPDAQDILNFLNEETAQDNCPGIWHNLLSGFNTFGNLTEGQVACVRNAIAQKAEKALYGASEFIGKIGDRITVTAKVDKIITVPCIAYHYGDRQSIDIYIFKSEGNIISWISKTIGKCKVTKNVITPGMVVDITATIKNHEVYKDENQTKINRPSFKIVKEA